MPSASFTDPSTVRCTFVTVPCMASEPANLNCQQSSIILSARSSSHSQTVLVLLSQDLVITSADESDWPLDLNKWCKLFRYNAPPLLLLISKAASLCAFLKSSSASDDSFAYFSSRLSTLVHSSFFLLLYRVFIFFARPLLTPLRTKKMAPPITATPITTMTMIRVFRVSVCACTPVASVACWC